MDRHLTGALGSTAEPPTGGGPTEGVVMTTRRGIPPVSDYSHWNEEAELVWYMENRYDMENGYEPEYDDKPGYADDGADLLVCTDCAIVAANGDWSGVPDERVPAVRAAMERLPRLVVGDPYGFSWSKCQSCGGDPGDRHEAWSGE